MLNLPLSLPMSLGLKVSGFQTMVLKAVILPLTSCRLKDDTSFLAMNTNPEGMTVTRASLVAVARFATTAGIPCPAQSQLKKPCVSLGNNRNVQKVAVIFCCSELNFKDMTGSWVLVTGFSFSYHNRDL